MGKAQEDKNKREQESKENGTTLQKGRIKAG